MKNGEKANAEVQDNAKPLVDNNITGGEAEVGGKAKTAFFITPLGGTGSEIRRATDGLIKAVIRPALERNNIALVPPHEILDPGNITRQIVRQILDCDLVIANLSGLNANVMYELAIRHAARKPVIVIADEATKLPFDIAAERTIFYRNDMEGSVELMTMLEKTIPVALADTKPENPVYSGLESSIIHEQIKEGGDNQLQSYVVDKLDQLTDAVAYMRNLMAHTNMNSSINNLQPNSGIMQVNFYFAELIEYNKVNVTRITRSLKTIYPKTDVLERVGGVSFFLPTTYRTETPPSFSLSKYLQELGNDLKDITVIGMGERPAW